MLFQIQKEMVVVIGESEFLKCLCFALFAF